MKHVILCISLMITYTSGQGIFTQRITENEGCRMCIDKRWTYYCTSSSRVPGIQTDQTGYCCEDYPLVESPSYCNKDKMFCTTEVNLTSTPSFRYTACPIQIDICGPQRDIIVYDYVKSFKSGYMYPNQTCMWRFVAASITQKGSAEEQKNLYRVIKIRIAGRDKVKLNALVIENPTKVQDNLALFEASNSKGIGSEWNMATRNGGLTIVNSTNQVYVVAVPEDYGGYVWYEYFVDYVEDPSNVFTQANIETASTDTSATSDEDEDPYFNNYTRKVVSYGLCTSFGLVFAYGIFRIWKIFFSAESKIIREIAAEVKAKRERELDIKQRRKREEKWMTYVDDGEMEGRAVGGWLTTDGTSAVSLMAGKEASYKEAFSEIGNKKRDIARKKKLEEIRLQEKMERERGITDDDIERSQALDQTGTSQVDVSTKGIFLKVSASPPMYNSGQASPNYQSTTLHNEIPFAHSPSHMSSQMSNTATSFNTISDNGGGQQQFKSKKKKKRIRREEDDLRSNMKSALEIQRKAKFYVE
ncbi:hypothetical protein FGO68_gene2500 [Halteria grandinella]|uniref:CUB domain-containing protein n=1 Tax=Halteria grandinella TaxID=5974 RepID=A0A8J8NAJ4_HALGN|nr:hypothetical protein FGO68_gene2500 [Halteria grandinella]